MGKVIKAIIGVVLIVVGIVTGQFWLAAEGFLITASAFMSPKQQARQAEAATLQLGEVARQAIFGEALVAGSLLDAFNYGGKYGTDWEVIVLAIADHYCEQLVGFYVNDAFVAYGGNGAVAGYSGQLEVYWMPGTEAQALPSILTTYGGWAAASNCAGVAVVVFAYKADASDAKNPIWTAGRPRFVSLVKGKRIYIGRRDSSIGGSGSHRWDNPATYEYSDNPIDCRYNWVRGVFACDRVDQPDMLLVGRGLSAIEAPPENTFWRAALCDEAVPLAGGGTEPRYRFGALIKADDQYIDTEIMFAATCAGVITQPEGSVEIEPGHAKTPAVYITDGDLLVGSTVSFSAFRSEADTEWVNTVIPRYIEPTQKWADHGAPIRRVSADVLADGGAREETLSLGAVSSISQAQRCGEIRRRMGQLLRTATITLGPRFAGVEEGDWIVWTSARHTGNAPVTFRVEAFGLDEKWQNTLSLREIATNVYAWSTADEIADGAIANQQDPPPGIGTPDAGSWSIAGGVITGSDGATQPALTVSGVVDDRYVDLIKFEYRVDDGSDPATATDWIDAGTAPPNTVDTVAKTMGPVETTRSYYAAVSYIVGGVIGDRLILGPVSTGNIAQAGSTSLAIRSAYYTAAGTLLTGSAVSGDGHITIAGQTWDYPTLGSEVVRSGATLTGLSLDTTYWVYFDDTTLTNTTPTYHATTTATDAINSAAHAARHYLGAVATPTSGSPPTGGGGGGGGYGCPDPATLILMANTAHDGPGGAKAAGDIAALTDWVWTRPELVDGTLGDWGAYQVSHASIIDCDDVREGMVDGQCLRASATHLLWQADRWQPFEQLAPHVGCGPVVRITVAGAHTYVAAGLISHNKRAEPDLD